MTNSPLFIGGAPGGAGGGGAVIPPGTVAPFAGFTAPAGWLLCDGAAYSRAALALLWQAIAIPGTADFLIASPIVTNISAGTGNMRPGMLLSGGLVPLGARILTVDSPTQITMDLPAIGSGAAQSFNVTPWGFGDNMFTFNVPDFRARSPLGVNDDPAATSLSARVLADAGGEENHALSDLENGQHLHTLTAWDAAAHTHAQPGQIPGIPGDVAAKPLPAAGAGTDTPTSLGGLGTPHNTMHPFTVCNFIVKT